MTMSLSRLQMTVKEELCLHDYKGRGARLYMLLVLGCQPQDGGCQTDDSRLLF
jgi:hypothetical protein